MKIPKIPETDMSIIPEEYYEEEQTGYYDTEEEQTSLLRHGDYLSA